MSESDHHDVATCALCAEQGLTGEVHREVRHRVESFRDEGRLRQLLFRWATVIALVLTGVAWWVEPEMVPLMGFLAGFFALMAFLHHRLDRRFEREVGRRF